MVPENNWKQKIVLFLNFMFSLAPFYISVIGLTLLEGSEKTKVK